MVDEPMTVSLQYAVAQLIILEEFGFPKQKAMEILDIDADISPPSSSRIAARKLNDVFSNAADHMDDPLIALRVGYGFRVGNFEDTGKVYSFCKNLTEVLKINALYQPLAVDIGHITTCVETDSSTNEKRYFLDYAPYCSKLKDSEHILMLVFGAYGTAFRWLTWSSAKELKGVYLQLPPPKTNNLHRMIFQCPVYFDQPYNRIEFDEDSMTAPLSTHDPVRKAQYIATLDKLLSADKAQASFLTSLRTTVENNLSSGRSSMQSIAGALGITKSKLQQSLKEHDIKYRDYLDNIRKDLFAEKYRLGKPFIEIALELGYNDQAAFSKAFKRWHGVSPTEFTQQDVEKNIKL